MSISQFYILSPRGDPIIYRSFRGDESTTEVFFRNVKFWGGKQEEAPPIFNLEGTNFFYIKKAGLYFVCMNKTNISAVFVMELLARVTKIFKDFTGILSEESVRTNFLLLYELLDEVLDFGYVQNTSTELLKQFVFNEAVVTKTPALTDSFKIPELNGKTKPSSSAERPIQSIDRKGKKNEIYVDIVERISLTFNSNGIVLNSAIDGTIQMKSYLAGNPELRLALNEELVVGKSQGPSYGAIEIDDCNFHECVKLSEFESQRILSFVPPDGEFVVMNYRMTGEFRAPFRIFPFIELVSPYKVELIVKIRADIPEQNHGGNVIIFIPVPKSTSNVTNQLAQGVVGQAYEFDQKEHRIIWKIKKFPGGTEQTLRSKITLSSAHTASVRKEIGPISMQYEIPMWNPSGLQVKYLRILESKNYNPQRWVRYVTKSSSYVCRL